MPICEKCNIEHDGSFGSGRFCSRSCANSRERSDELKHRVSQSLIHNYSNIFYLKCEFCGKTIVKKRKGGKYCSVVCGNKDRNITDETRRKISKRVRREYVLGKKVYGGKTKWIEYKDIKVQGTYELRTCKILDRWKENGIIETWEYTNDRVSYINIEGNKSRYLLDFKVIRKDGSFYYIETKGRIKDNDELKWDAVRDLGYELQIWTIDHIKEYECR